MQQLKLIILLLVLLTNTIVAQKTSSETLLHNNVLREYIIYKPKMYDGMIPVPLMFNFHGYTGNANRHLGSTKMQALADTANFILVYPQGTLFNGSTHWNVGSWTRGSTSDDIGFTEAMIDTVASKYNIDLNRVYSCGFSNGGYFSFELACQLSHRIAAIGSVGGKMSSETYNACNPVHPTPVVTIHGTNDNVVAYEGSQPVASKSVREVNSFWVNFNNTDDNPVVENIPNINTSDGSTVEYYTYNKGNNCTTVAHYKVIGGGHDWPGAWGNKDIDASSVIWNFVSQYDINGLINCNLTTNINILEQENKIKLYPNPTTGFVTIEMDNRSNQPYYIYSITGRILRSGQIDARQKTIDLSGLLPNSYILKIGHHSRRFVKIE